MTLLRLVKTNIANSERHHLIDKPDIFNQKSDFNLKTIFIAGSMEQLRLTHLRVPKHVGRTQLANHISS